MRKAWTAGLAGCAVAAAVAAVAAVAGIPVTSAGPAASRGPAGGHPPRVVVAPGTGRLAGSPRGPLSTAQCRRAYGIACYQPGQLRAAYNLAPAVPQRHHRQGADDRDR
jgi:hypothetical protein